MEQQEIALNLQNISFSYSKDSKTISDFNLKVVKGSFTTLLGESGCGKTTLLRLISGFLKPEKGIIEIDGINQNGIEPNNRKIGVVFQDYALFPHLTVKQNILYGVKSKNNEKEKTKEKLLQTIDSLNLQGLLNRFPHELSGGQQQRVALARSLILNPKILLMDEPLSGLDTKLREKVRDELKIIQKKFKITTVYVTHDREEALSLSDSIAVIKDGKILQHGSPKDLYFTPKNSFIADFVGHADFLSFDNKLFMIRPEWLCINYEKKQGDIQGKIIDISFLGEKTRYKIELLNKKNISIDLNTLYCNSLNIGNDVSLNILNKWELKE